MRIASSIAVLCSLCAAVPAWAETPAEVAATATASATGVPGLTWGRLQGRLAFSTHATPLRERLPSSDTAFKVTSLSVMGDYYLRPSLNQLTLGGWRATSGLLIGQQPSLWGPTHKGLLSVPADRRYGTEATDSGTAPYVGLGYSGTGGHLGRSGSWGFSADVGLMSLSPGSFGRLGRVLNGSQNLDDIVRDLRLAPVLQVGFSYSF